MIRRGVAGAGALCAVIAAVAVLVATWRHLQVGALLEGVGQGYRLPQLAVGAAAGACVVLCVQAAVRRSGAVLLAGPVLLLALGLQAATSGTTTTYDGSYVPLLGVTSSQAYSSELTLVLGGSPWLDGALLLLAAGAGACVVAASVRRGTRPPGPAPRP